MNCAQENRVVIKLKALLQGLHSMIPYMKASFPKRFRVALEGYPCDPCAGYIKKYVSQTHSTDSPTIGINYEVGLLKKVCLIACSSAKMNEECPVCGWWLQPIGQRGNLPQRRMVKINTSLKQPFSFQCIVFGSHVYIFSTHQRTHQRGGLDQDGWRMLVNIL